MASCVDADLDDDGTPAGNISVKTAGRGAAAAEKVGSRAVNGPSSTPPSIVSAAPIMRIPFRGIFEAFAATLEASPTRGSGGGSGAGVGGILRRGGSSADGPKGVVAGRGGGVVEGVGCEEVALLLYSMLQVCLWSFRTAVARRLLRCVLRKGGSDGLSGRCFE